MQHFPIVWFCLSIVVQPLVDRDVLEPSVQNEVDHALAKAPREMFEKFERFERGEKGERLPFPTNGMSRTDIAIRLVSEQKPDGRWRVGTNDVTAVAVEILKSL